MTSQERNHYGVEPANENALESGKPASAPESRPASKPPPIELERESEPSERPLRDEDSTKQSVKELDVCPNCGASMRGTDALVCLRCGFDLKTMRVVKTEVGEAVEPVAEAPPLVRPGMGDLWLPAVIAAACGGFLLICYMAGV